MLIVPELRAGNLVRLLTDYRRDGADFNVLMPSRRQVPSAVSAFVEFATQRLRSIVSNTDFLPAPIALQRRKRS